MEITIASILALIVAILGSSVFNQPLVQAYVLAVSFKTEARISFAIAFISGLFVSLTEGSTLGMASLALLLASGVVHLYGRRFSARNWAFTMVFAALGSLAYSMVMEGKLMLWRALADSLLVILFLPLVSWWRSRFVEEQILIRV